LPEALWHRNPGSSSDLTRYLCPNGGVYLSPYGCDPMIPQVQPRSRKMMRRRMRRRCQSSLNLVLKICSTLYEQLH
jgi:hypothetical protein